MGEQYTRLELKKIAKFLRKVYPGMSEQDELWALIEKTEQLLSKGKHGTSNRRRGDHK
jgi:hypothetical protein